MDSKYEVGDMVYFVLPNPTNNLIRSSFGTITSKHCIWSDDDKVIFRYVVDYKNGCFEEDISKSLKGLLNIISWHFTKKIRRNNIKSNCDN